MTTVTQTQSIDCSTDIILPQSDSGNGNGAIAPFQILDHIDKLSPAKQKGRYICPNCEGDNLTISQDGAYQCWNGCECKDIREAIAPWSEREHTPAPQRGYSKPTKSAKPKPAPQRGYSKPTKSAKPKPAPLPELINLARLPHPATDCPQPQKRLDKQHGEVEEWVYDYGNNQYKTRTHIPDSSKVKGYTKNFTLWHRDASGKAIPKSGEGVRLPYRIEGAIATAKAGGANAIMGCEGEKGAEIYRGDVGLACVTLCSFSSAELALLAQMLKDAELGLVYHPDFDQAGWKKSVRVKEACDRAGVPFLIINPTCLYPVDANLPEGGDIAEILAAMEVPEFIRKLEDEIQYRAGGRRDSESRRDAEPRNTSGSFAPKAPNGGGGDKQDAFKEIESRYSTRLRLNRLSGQVELDGKPIRVDEFYITLRRRLGLKVNKQLTIDLVMQLARENEYSPASEYLIAVSEQHGDTTTSLLEDAASRYFGTTEPLYNIYLKRMMIGAVARQLNPGCKLDTALVLQGKQGYFKSTFFDILAGPWFDDSLGDANNKDERLKLRASWFLEWAELERAFSKRSNGDLKAFMSTKVDNFRVPYGRAIESFPRHCVLVGTSNEEEFLADPTGDRRFWIVPIQKSIDIKLLAEERDRLWAAAVALYRKGEQWWLTSEEAARSQELNQPFRVEDPWLPHVSDYVEGLPDSGGFSRVYTKSILENCLQLDKGKQERSVQMRVAAILKRLGFNKKPDSKGLSCWQKVSVPLNDTVATVSATQLISELIPTDTSVSKVSVPSNDLAATVSATQLIPTDTFSVNLNKSSDESCDQKVNQSEVEKQKVCNFEAKVSVLDPAEINNNDISMVPATDTSTDTFAGKVIAPTATPQPTPNNLTLEIGDRVVGPLGKEEEIARFTQGGYLAISDNFISRADWVAGRYTRIPSAPVEENPAQVSASMLIGLGEDIANYQLLVDVAEEWSKDFKLEVWALLPAELRQRYKALKEGNG